MRKIGNSWKKKLGVISFLLVYFAATTPPVSARPRMQVFPMWQRMECRSLGNTGAEAFSQFACYNLTQAKAIYTIDLEIQLQFNELKQWKKKFDAVDQAYQKLHEAYALHEETIARLTTRLQEKDEALVSTTRALEQAAADNIWNYASWIIVGSVVIFGASFGLGFYLGDR